MKCILYINSISTVHCEHTNKIKDMVNISIVYEDGQTINTNIKTNQNSRVVDYKDIYDTVAKYFKGEIQFMNNK